MKKVKLLIDGVLADVSVGAANKSTDIGPLTAVEVPDARHVPKLMDYACERILADGWSGGTCSIVMDRVPLSFASELIHLSENSSGGGFGFFDANSSADVRDVFCEISKCRYGEFSIFLSDEAREIQGVMLKELDNLEAISIMSKKALALSWLIGLDIESDTVILASRDRREMLSLAVDIVRLSI